LSLRELFNIPKLMTLYEQKDNLILNNDGHSEDNSKLDKKEDKLNMMLK